MSRASRLFPSSIETERVRLREPRREDAQAIFESYARDEEVCRYMIWTPHDTSDTTLAFIEECINDWTQEGRYPYVVTDQQTGAVLGMFDARRSGSAMLNIGYVLARSHWGQGIMPEVVQAFAQHALGLATIFRIQATCDVDNIGSQRVLEKSGFVREARMERYMVHPNLEPEPRASYLYARWR